MKSLNQQNLELANEFINHFAAIPESKWNSGFQYKGDGTCCALGHLNYSYSRFVSRTWKTSEKQMQLRVLFIDCGIPQIKPSDGPAGGNLVAQINNGDHHLYQQETPKQRILAALEDVKKYILLSHQLMNS